VTNVIPFQKALSEEELEDKLLDGTVKPEAQGYVITTITTQWYNHGVISDLMDAAIVRYDLKISAETKKMGWGRKDHLLRIHGSNLKIMLFVGTLDRY
jgi:hypothetical protein